MIVSNKIKTLFLNEEYNELIVFIIQRKTNQPFLPEGLQKGKGWTLF